MKKKLAFGCVAIVINLMSTAISFYLLYRVFLIVVADSLMWFLFWANVPLVVIFTILARIVQNTLEEENK